MDNLKKTMLAILGQNVMAAGSRLKVSDVVIAACYKRSFVTKSQIMLMLPGKTYASVSTNINRLVSNGLLKSCYKQSAVGEKTVYMLTNKGIEYASGLINTLYPYDAELSAELAAAYHCDGITSYNHKIYANDIYFYYCSRDDSPMYSFFKECAIDTAGTPISMYNAQNGMVQRKGVLVSDAYIEYTVDYPYNDLVYTQIIYMEQDMRTQRAAVIADKISNYYSALKDKDSLNTSEILFMVHVDRDRGGGKPLLALGAAAVRIVKFIVMYIKIFEHMQEPSAYDVYSCIAQHREDILSSGVIADNALKEMMQKFHDISEDELKGLTAAALLKAEREDDGSAIKRQYFSRRNQLIRCIYDCNIQSLIYAGLNILFSCNEDIAGNYDYTHVYGNRMLLKQLRGFYNNDNLEYCISYRKNGVSYPSSLAVNELLVESGAAAAAGNIVIENISDSVGGIMRAQKYISDDGIRNKRLVLLSSTRKDAVKFIRNVVKDNIALIKDNTCFVFYADGELCSTAVYAVNSVTWQQPGKPEYTFKELYNTDDPAVG